EGFEKLIPKLYFARGNYFKFLGKSPFSRLVYPLPEPGGLGIHYTIDLNMQGRLGPDVEWIEDLDFTPNPVLKNKFVQEASKYWPEISYRELYVDYCGIRPKLSAKGEPAADFKIMTPQDFNGAPLVQTFGIESPGLTSSLAIAQEVAKIYKNYYS
ncbi:MAG: FAD-dependent oxidoreductase, partial [Caulobacterales bacterium]|nr:FAD-dependent oxidoreductase [Caulobacterales bacterium]